MSVVSFLIFMSEEFLTNLAHFRRYVHGDTLAPLSCADTGGGGIGNPPTAVCNFFLLVDLPRTLQKFGSAPEIPVRNPPPF